MAPHDCRVGGPLSLDRAGYAGVRSVGQAGGALRPGDARGGHCGRDGCAGGRASGGGGTRLGRDHRVQAGDRLAGSNDEASADGHALYGLAPGRGARLLVQGASAAGGVLRGVPRAVHRTGVHWQVGAGAAGLAGVALGGPLGGGAVERELGERGGHRHLQGGVRRPGIAAGGDHLLPRCARVHTRAAGAQLRRGGVVRDAVVGAGGGDVGGGAGEPRALRRVLRLWAGGPAQALPAPDAVDVRRSQGVDGAGDDPSGNPFFDQFRAYFPDLRGEPVPEAGHFFPEEKPEFTNARLRRFLDGDDR